MTGLVLALASFLQVAAPAGGDRGGPPPAPDVESLSPAERERLASGEPVVLPGGGVGRWVQAVVTVDAAPEEVWAVMVDCPRAAEFVPGLRSCRVLESEGETALVEHRSRPSPLLPEMAYVFRERREPFRSIRFRRVSGSLTRLEGRWDLTKWATGRTLVWYTISMDPGFLVPDWAVRRALARDLPELLTALKRRVEEGD
ncbi:MAG TPA: SRPBCC family protein [Thermoanaerobaculia bacterium]|nr:SRPBCC family protein [Thermoanaerobaculia bacterium]